jgi:hypothetical protein
VVFLLAAAVTPADAGADTLVQNLSRDYPVLINR